MNIVTLSCHILLAFVMVVSLFLSIRFIFAHEMRIAAWHAPVHYRYGINRSTFKRLVHMTGWLLLAVFLLVTYLQTTSTLDL